VRACARRVGALLAVGLAVALAPAGARAQEGTVVDRVAVRFLSTETGGAAHPRFITARILHFEAHLQALAEQIPQGDVELYERHVRAALEQHVAEEMLAAIPLDRPPTPAERGTLKQQLRLALVERLGNGQAQDGEQELAAAAAEDGIAPEEIDAMLDRQARAAIYLDLQSPILNPDDEQLREVFRTSAHPYRGKGSFETVRAPLGRWFVAERLRVAEGSFLQQARTRVKIVAIQG
jgi:hypothetical protein